MKNTMELADKPAVSCCALQVLESQDNLLLLNKFQSLITTELAIRLTTLVEWLVRLDITLSFAACTL